LPIVITHMKPAGKREEITKQELEELNDLHLDLYSPNKLSVWSFRGSHKTISRLDSEADGTPIRAVGGDGEILEKLGKVAVRALRGENDPSRSGC
jgi:hypothetical protein